jgi:hypothetical protein
MSIVAQNRHQFDSWYTTDSDLLECYIENAALYLEEEEIKPKDRGYYSARQMRFAFKQIYAILSQGLLDSMLLCWE